MLVDNLQNEMKEKVSGLEQVVLKMVRQLESYGHYRANKESVGKKVTLLLNRSIKIF